MRDLTDIKLKDILPDSISKDGNVSASAESIDPHLQVVGGKVDIPLIYANIDNLEHAALDSLAYQFDMTNWDEGWARELKVAVLKDVIKNKRKVGTLKAVKEAAEALGNAVEIIEWWQTEPKGHPHTFTVKVTFGGASPTISAEVRRSIDLAKPLRSHYYFDTGHENIHNVYVLGAMSITDYNRVIATAPCKKDIANFAGYLSAMKSLPMTALCGSRGSCEIDDTSIILEMTSEEYVSTVTNIRWFGTTTTNNAATIGMYPVPIDRAALHKVSCDIEFLNDSCQGGAITTMAFDANKVRIPFANGNLGAVKYFVRQNNEASIKAEFDLSLPQDSRIAYLTYHFQLKGNALGAKVKYSNFRIECGF
jgi:phage tail P2-like protein